MLTDLFIFIGLSAYAFGEEKCAWVTCIGHTANTSAICTKLGEGQIGSEFIQFVQKETGSPGETVTIECVDRAKDYLVVPQLAGSVRMGP